ncbi:MAG: ATP synthase subunit I [Syntrophaceae bacterium]|nr:ATP synthase subunit I [Syntrophaceae bacterium]
MNETHSITVTILSLAFVAGLALGVFYFAGLWQTVKKMPSSEHQLRLIIGSFALRMIIVLTAFYFIMGSQWERLAAALTGFIVMKIILTKKLGIKKTV